PPAPVGREGGQGGEHWDQQRHADQRQKPPRATRAQPVPLRGRRHPRAMVASVVASDFEPTAKLFVPPASGTVVRPARLTPQEAWPSEGGAGMLDDAATMRWTPYCGPGATPDDW